MSASQLRTEQLRILDAVVAFCEEHGLTCMLYAGTLLGAVRHRGFIPWDDDVDLLMSREDFERFCVNFDVAGLDLFAPRLSDHCYPHSYAKVSRIGTLVEESLPAGVPIGVNVDVFPYDRVASGAVSWLVQRALSAAIRGVITASLYGSRPGRPVWRRAVLGAARALTRVVSVGQWSAWRTGVARMAEGSSRYSVGELVGSVAWRMPLSGIEPVSEVIFEGRRLPAPAAPKRLLTQMYGDFMVLPPAAKQVAPHEVRAFYVETQDLGGQGRLPRG